MNENVGQHLGDAGALAILASYMGGFLPSIATVFTIVWLGIRIFESCTVQKLVKRFRREKPSPDVKKDH